MTARLFILFVFASLLIAGFTIPGPLKNRLRGDNGNIGISIRENEEKITLTASYPKSSSQSVHEYIKNYFGINNITDMDAVELKQFETPDGSIRFHIKSRNGYLKLVLNKFDNPQQAVGRIKEAAEGIKKVLAGN